MDILQTLRNVKKHRYLQSTIKIVLILKIKTANYDVRKEVELKNGDLKLEVFSFLIAIRFLSCNPENRESLHFTSSSSYFLFPNRNLFLGVQSRIPKKSLVIQKIIFSTPEIT